MSNAFVQNLLSVITFGVYLYASWHIFIKANKPPWHALVPIYGNLAWLDLVQFPRWFFLAPVVAAVANALLLTNGLDVLSPVFIGVLIVLNGLALLLYLAFNVFLARAFGKGLLFAAGLIFLPVIFHLILAFDNSQYIYTFDLDKIKYSPDDDTLLRVQNLRVYFPTFNRDLFRTRAADVRAVDGVSFEMKRGETLSLVGESGSGKTTIGRSILNAVTPTGGDVSLHVDGVDYTLAVESRLPERFRETLEQNLPQQFHENALDNTRRDLLRSEIQRARTHMQMIFQDPYASLNPRMTVYDIIAEPLMANNLATGDDLRERVHDIAIRCKLNVEHLRRFPHAFSGGQRQRIGIARALVTQPKFIVCDESVSALDVSIQAEILNLLADLQKDFNTAYLFIAHDLSVVAHISDRVAVMYLGQIVELAPTRQLFAAPKHPYTEALMSAIPEIDPEQRLQPIPLEGEIPSPTNPPSGCRFHTRCPYAQERCKTVVPELVEYAPGHYASCHFVEELDLKGANIPGTPQEVPVQKVS